MMVYTEHDFRPLVIKDRISLGESKTYLPAHRREIVSVRLRFLKRPNETYFRSSFSITADGMRIVELSGAAMNKPVRLDIDRILVEPPFGLAVAFSTRQEQGDDFKHQVEYEITMKPIRQRRLR